MANLVDMSEARAEKATKEPSKVLAGIEYVQAALSKLGIDKSDRNQSQGFNFRGIDAVMEALSPLLVEARLSIVPRVVDLRREEAVNPTNGKVTRTTLVLVEYSLVSLVDGSIIQPLFAGEGQDGGDKATGKAFSMAYKQFVFQTFCVPVEGQDDADRTTPEPTVKAVAKQESAYDFAKELAAIAAVNTIEELQALRDGDLNKVAKKPGFHVTIKNAYKAKLAELQS